MFIYAYLLLFLVISDSIVPIVFYWYWGKVVATISKRKKANGSIVYDARISVKENGKFTFRKSKTFNSKSIAQTWVKRIEREIEEEFAKTGNTICHQTFKEVAVAYLRHLEMQDDLRRTKRSTIEFLIKQPFAELNISSITSKDIIKYFRRRVLEDGAKPQTVNNDKAYISSVLKYAAVMLDLPVNLNELTLAVELAREHKLIGKPTKRDRRITASELDSILKFYESKPVLKYMLDIVDFAINSSRRQSEITRLKWDDLDVDSNTIKVRDMKHPTIKNFTKTCKLTNKALDIILRQPKNSEYIFNFNPKTIGSNFSKACKILEIHDLRFHDLRHEATSRLFEAGYSIVEVQQFTLHEDWATLKRYTHLRPENLKLKD